LTAQAASFTSANPTDVKKLESLISRLYQLVQLKHAVELRFEPLQRATGHDELRFNLMKLSLAYDGLSKELKAYLDKFVGPEATDFKGLLQATVAGIPRNTTEASVAQGLEDGWLGTRLEVELPVSKAYGLGGVKKSIVPEMINQRFMWVDDYFHYDDWKGK
jgi:hypothetical protein